MASAGRWPRKPPDRGFEDIVDLVVSALPGAQEDAEGKVAAAMRQYLRDVGPDSREAPVLAAARHALTSSRLSGRPSLVAYACKTVARTVVPRCMELCGPGFPSYDAVVVQYHDNGLFANVLQVCDALLLVGPGAVVAVDWQRKGPEGHFQYGPEGFDLFGHLFEPCERCRPAPSGASGEPPATVAALASRVCPVFHNMLRGYFWTMPEGDLGLLRRRFAGALACLRPSARVRRRVEDAMACLGADAVVVGVHKRLGTPEVAACQLSQRAPSTEEFVAKARSLLAARADGGRKQAVFLASDDELAVAAFEEAFPPGGPVDLCLRRGVRRSVGGVREDGVDNEVHRSPCEAEDAEDALADALCLARCSDLVCIDSNLSIFAALWNPGLRLHPLSSLLPEGWEDASLAPDEPVHQRYEVVFKPMVFVRAGPSAACELLGARKVGEVVEATGRGYDGWIEIRGGGWMLTDGERILQNRGSGLLLRPVGPALPPPGAAALGGHGGCEG